MSDLNDPRVLFAAERTLMAWNRTAISLMAFGFVIERFGLFVQLVAKEGGTALYRGTSFYIGVIFLLLACLMLLYSIIQHHRILKTLKPVEVPEGYNIYTGMAINAIIALLGLVLTASLMAGWL